MQTERALEIKHPPIIVVGLARSGTSMIAGILARMGVFMGFDYLKLLKANSKGCYEDKDMVELISKFFEGGVLKKMDNAPMEFAFNFHTFIEDRRKLNRIWGFKEPGTSILLPYILQFIPDGMLFAVKRDEEAIAKSMAKLHDLPLEESKKLTKVRAKKFNDDIKALRGKVPILEIQYEELLKDPDKYVDEIAHYIALPGIKRSLEYVDPKLNHEGHI